MGLLYGIRISAKASFVLSQFTRFTNRQTDKNLVANTTLYSMRELKIKVYLFYNVLPTEAVSKSY